MRGGQTAARADGGEVGRPRGRTAARVEAGRADSGEGGRRRWRRRGGRLGGEGGRRRGPGRTAVGTAAGTAAATAAGTAAATAAVAAAATAAAAAAATTTAAAATDPAEKATDTRDVSKDDLCTDRDLGVRKEGVRGQHTTGPGHPGGRRAPRGPGTQYGQLRRGGTPSQLAILEYRWSELGTFNGQPAGPETPPLISEGHTSARSPDKRPVGTCSSMALNFRSSLTAAAARAPAGAPDRVWARLGMRSSARPLWSHTHELVRKFAFSGSQKLKIFLPRRGGASRPARPDASRPARPGGSREGELEFLPPVTSTSWG